MHSNAHAIMETIAKNIVLREEQESMEAAIKAARDDLLIAYIVDRMGRDEDFRRTVCLKIVESEWF